MESPWKMRGWNSSFSRWWQLKQFWNFHPDPLGFHDPIWRLHIFQMGWFNHQLGDIPNKYPLYKVDMGLIIKGTIPRVPPFSLWMEIFMWSLSGNRISREDSVTWLWWVEEVEEGDGHGTPGEFLELMMSCLRKGIPFFLGGEILGRWKWGW